VNWSKRKVIVTGGAGFIGSGLVDNLLEKGAEVTVVDKLLFPAASWIWNAKLGRLSDIYKKHGYKDTQFQIIDLYSERERFQLLAQNFDVVFHLSAVFGGRTNSSKLKNGTPVFFRRLISFLLLSGVHPAECSM